MTGVRFAEVLPDRCKEMVFARRVVCVALHTAGISAYDIASAMGATSKSPAKKVQYILRTSGDKVHALAALVLPLAQLEMSLRWLPVSVESKTTILNALRRDMSAAELLNLFKVSP